MAVPRALCSLVLITMIGRIMGARMMNFNWNAFALVNCWMGAPAAPDPSRIDLWSSEVWCYHRMPMEDVEPSHSASRMFGSYLWQSSMNARCYPVAYDSSRMLRSEDYVPYQNLVRQLVDWENPFGRPTFGGCRNRVDVHIAVDAEAYPSGTSVGFLALEHPSPGVSYKCYSSKEAKNVDFQDGTVCSMLYYCHN